MMICGTKFMDQAVKLGKLDAADCLELGSFRKSFYDYYITGNSNCINWNINAVGPGRVSTFKILPP